MASRAPVIVLPKERRRLIGRVGRAREQSAAQDVGELSERNESWVACPEQRVKDASQRSLNRRMARFEIGGNGKELLQVRTTLLADMSDDFPGLGLMVRAPDLPRHQVVANWNQARTLKV